MQFALFDHSLLIDDFNHILSLWISNFIDLAIGAVGYFTNGLEGGVFENLVEDEEVSLLDVIMIHLKFG
jgi:hypothetical protein